MKFKLWDDAGAANTYTLSSSHDFLVPGTILGDSSDTCYLPVFGTDKSENNWYAGNFILNYLYLVFDMTPFDEHG